MSFLKIEKLYKKFDDTPVLKGINFEMEKGEVVAIIGSSGSGKTTLLRCLNFLERPQEGKIFVDDNLIFDAADKQAKENDIRKKRLHFGLVFQSFNLFPQYNVKKNIELATIMQAKELLKNKRAELKNELLQIKKSIKEIKQTGKEFGNIISIDESANIDKFNAQFKTLKAEIPSKIEKFKKDEKERIENVADKLLNRVGLIEKANSYPCQLSGGQQQRVAIARALALSPDILCFDEPTSALDPELTGEVLRVIKGLKSGDTTMIVVTHEMDFAKNVADKIIFMANGIIEEEATPQEFFENPKSDIAKAFINKSFEEI